LRFLLWSATRPIWVSAPNESHIKSAPRAKKRGKNGKPCILMPCWPLSSPRAPKIHVTGWCSRWQRHRQRPAKALAFWIIGPSAARSCSRSRRPPLAVDAGGHDRGDQDKGHPLQ